MNYGSIVFRINSEGMLEWHTAKYIPANAGAPGIAVLPTVGEFVSDRFCGYVSAEYVGSHSIGWFVPSAPYAMSLWSFPDGHIKVYPLEGKNYASCPPCAFYKSMEDFFKNWTDVKLYVDK